MLTDLIDFAAWAATAAGGPPPVAYVLCGSAPFIARYLFK